MYNHNLYSLTEVLCKIITIKKLFLNNDISVGAPPKDNELSRETWFTIVVWSVFLTLAKSKQNCHRTIVYLRD